MVWSCRFNSRGDWPGAVGKSRLLRVRISMPRMESAGSSGAAKATGLGSREENSTRSRVSAVRNRFKGDTSQAKIYNSNSDGSYLGRGLARLGTRFSGAYTNLRQL